MVDASPAVSAAWSVQALLLAASDALVARFGACTVRGELASYTQASSGHCYFTLKDADGAPASLRCAMFRRAAVLLDFAPRAGQQVELRGRIAVYEPRGELQFVVEAMRPVGAGSLHEQFLRLKARLEAEGLFDPARRRPLPAHPRRIGIVTSLGGAALHDMLTTLARRAPQVEVLLYPSLVQGADAPAALCAALALATRRAEVDVIVLARGGGPLEDLWAFNDERVVRAVAASPIPVVCGIGHETDFTLADFAADLRAPTPTAAAELVAPSRGEALARLAGLAARARRQVQRRLEQAEQRLDHRAAQLGRPAERLARHARRLDALVARRRPALRQALAAARRLPNDLARRLGRAQSVGLSRERDRLAGLQARLSALDPRRVLGRGYAWVTDVQGTPLVSARGLTPGETLQAVWHDGHALARVEQVSLDPDPTA